MPIYFYESDIGEIGIAEKDGVITNLHFANDKLPQDIQIYETSILKEAAQQLKNYLTDSLKELPKKKFDIYIYRKRYSLYGSIVSLYLWALPVI